MASYYRDLHDKELLSLGESIFTELERRRLIEVRVPCNERSKEDPGIVKCSIVSAERKGNLLSLLVDRHFERAALLPGQRADNAASGGDNR